MLILEARIFYLSRNLFKELVDLWSEHLTSLAANKRPKAKQRGGAEPMAQ